jgi:hypothetical protein
VHDFATVGDAERVERGDSDSDFGDDGTSIDAANVLAAACTAAGTMVGGGGVLGSRL